MAEVKTSVSVALSPEVVKRVDALSGNETTPEFLGRSRSSIIEHILRKYLNKNVEKKPRR